MEGWSAEKWIVVILAIIFLPLAILEGIWLIQGNNFFLHKIFNPQMEQVRQDTFKNSQAYNEGMARDIFSLQTDYIKATDPQVRSGLKSVILQKLAGYDTTKFPPNLRKFVDNLRGD